MPGYQGLERAIQSAVAELYPTVPDVEPDILTDHFPEKSNISLTGYTAKIVTESKAGALATPLARNADPVEVNLASLAVTTHDLISTAEYFPIDADSVRILQNLTSDKKQRAQVYNDITARIKNRVVRLKNYQKAQDLFNRGVLASQTNATSDIFSIDYGVPAANKVTLAGNFVWGGTTDDPVADLVDLVGHIEDNSGLPATTILSDRATFNLFVARAAVHSEFGPEAIHQLNTTRRLTFSGLDLAWQIVVGNYKNLAGTVTNYATTNRVVITANAQGTPVGVMDNGIPVGINTPETARGFYIWVKENEHGTRHNLYVASTTLAILTRPTAIGVLTVA